jgi:hypothetical protein
VISPLIRAACVAAAVTLSVALPAAVLIQLTVLAVLGWTLTLILCPRHDRSTP